MGVNISEIVPRKEIELEDLKGKIIAVDAYNTIYQFLTTIRQPDGTPLQDSKGRISSHLSGLFYRNINLLQLGIKPVYVFDGKPSELKYWEIKKRKERKDEAKERYEEAKKEEDVESMRKYSSQFVKITPEILSDSKALLRAMGIPVIEANGEGEAEASFLVRNKKAWAAGSQDYDALLFGASKLVRNLTLARKRRTSSGLYVEVKIELIELEDVVNKLGVDLDQLICLGILVGTDFNPGGVKGIGQKIALDIVKKYKYPFEIFKYIQGNEKYEMNFDWQAVYKEFHDYEVGDGEISFESVDEKAVKELLLDREFSENRIDSGLDKLRQVEEEKKQKGLGEFF